MIALMSIDSVAEHEQVLFRRYFYFAMPHAYESSVSMDREYEQATTQCSHRMTSSRCLYAFRMYTTSEESVSGFQIVHFYTLLESTLELFRNSSTSDDLTFTQPYCERIFAPVELQSATHKTRASLFDAGKRVWTRHPVVQQQGFRCALQKAFRENIFSRKLHLATRNSSDSAVFFFSSIIFSRN